MKNFLFLRCGLSALAMLLAGCAAVPLGDPAQDRALKTFASPGAVAGVYVFRDPSLGAGKAMQIQIDGVDIGRTDAGTYLYTPLEPGLHRMRSQAESVDQLDFDAPAGRLVFIRQEVSPGLFAPDARLHLVSEDVGKRGVQASRLAFVGALPDGARSGRSASAVALTSVPAAVAPMSDVPVPATATEPPLAAPAAPATSATNATTATTAPAKPAAPATSSIGLLAMASPPKTEALPAPAPRRLGDDSALPYVNAHGRSDYRAWLSWSKPRAFAIANNGAWYAAQGTVASDKLPTDPAQRALALCQQRAGIPCALYAVDDSLVWGSEPARATP